jgi:uncharacterized protein YkwD
LPRSAARVISLGCAIAAMFGVLPPLAQPAGGGSQQAMSVLDAGILTQLNAIRIAHGLVPLTPSPQLTSAALSHSRQMAADGYFAHDSADGSPYWRRIKRYVPSSAHDRNWSVGENLIWHARDVDPATALALWMASPEHRANILNPLWREIGVAAVRANYPPGVYGQAATIITTDFASQPE